MDGIRKTDLAGYAALFFLRLTQLSCVSISCYGVCYLIYMHNHHPCIRNPYYCRNGTAYTGNQQVPIVEVVMVVTCVLLALEFVYTTGTTILRLIFNKRPDTFTNMCAAWASVGLFSIGLLGFASHKDVRQTWPFCYGVWFNNRFDAVEKNFCIVTQGAVTCGLIAWIAAALIAVLSVWDFRKDRGIGAIKLGSGGPPEDLEGVAVDDLEASNLPNLREPSQAHPVVSRPESSNSATQP